MDCYAGLMWRDKVVVSALGASEALTSLREAGFAVTAEARNSFEINQFDDPEAPPLRLRFSNRPWGTELELYVRYPKPTLFARLWPWTPTFVGAGFGFSVALATGFEVFVAFGSVVGFLLGTFCFSFDKTRFPVQIPKEQRPAVLRLFQRVHDAVGAGTGRDSFRRPPLEPSGFSTGTGSRTLAESTGVEPVDMGGGERRRCPRSSR